MDERSPLNEARDWILKSAWLAGGSQGQGDLEERSPAALGLGRHCRAFLARRHGANGWFVERICGNELVNVRSRRVEAGKYKGGVRFLNRRRSECFARHMCLQMVGCTEV